MFERLKSAMSGFCEAFWQSFYEARAESRAGAQSAAARVDDKPALATAGIDKNLADRARKYAAIPEQRSAAQPAQLDAGHPFFESEAIKAALIDVVRAAFADGVAAEKARVEAILTAPAAAMFIDLAADLVRGPATAAQAAGVLARAETDAAKRASLLKTSLLESASAPAIH